MKERWLTLLLVLPVFVYLGALLVTGFQGWDVLNGTAFVLEIALGVAPFLSRPLSRMAFLLSLGVSAASLVGLAALGAQGLDLTAGLLLASPFVAGLAVWSPLRSPAARIAALALGLLDGLVLVATLHVLSVLGEPMTTWNLLTTYGSVNYEQIQGLIAILQGTSSPSGLPLQAAVDPVFVLLAAVALLGIFVPLLRPQTASGEDLPMVEVDAEAPVGPGLVDLAAPEIRAALAEASRPRPPPSTQVPGLLPILLPVGVVLAFVYVGYSDPTWVLLPLALGIAAVAVGLLAVAGRHVPVPVASAQAPAPLPALASTTRARGGIRLTGRRLSPQRGGPATPPPAVAQGQ